MGKSKRRKLGAVGLRNYSTYDGANESARRGLVYMPTLNTRKQLGQYDREALMKKARWCFGNVGIGRRCTEGLAGLVGNLIPNPSTGDAEWNRLAREALSRRVSSPLAFDLAGAYNWDTAQEMLDTCRFRDGDMLVVFSSNSQGQARFGFYEGHQVVTPDYKDAGAHGWHDGVKTDAHGLAIAYGVRNNVNGAVVEVSARDAVLYKKSASPGQLRGVSLLSLAVNNIIDIVETRADIKHAIKVATLFGLALTSQKEQVSGGFPLAGMSAKVEEREAGDGHGADHDVVQLENVFSGGLVSRLRPGEDLKTLKDDRPSPAYNEFVKTIVQDISWGCGLPYSIIWDISGLTGPAVRYSLNEVDRWTRNNLALKQSLLKRMYVYILAKEMKAGLLPACKDAGWWDKVEWIPMASLTIDAGRDGSEDRARLREGLMTGAQFVAKYYGKDYEGTVRQVVAEAVLRRKVCDEMGVAYADVYGGAAGLI